MARPLRVVVPGAWYHVMARGLERWTIYSDEGYYRRFEELLADLPERFGVRLHTYVLMPNHYHLQIENGEATGRLGEDHHGDRETVEKTLERSQWTPRRPGTRVSDVDCPPVWRYEPTGDW